MVTSTAARRAARRTGAAAVLAAFLLVSCSPAPSVPPGSAPPTVPTASPPSSTPASTTPAIPTPTPAPAAWRWQKPVQGSDGWVAVGPAGSVYAAGSRPGCDLEVHAFDAAGRETIGWPYCGAKGQWPLGVDGAGTVYLGSGTTVVGVDAAGQVGSSWPRPAWFGMALLDEGIIVLRTPSILASYDPAGRDLPGWPVPLPGQVVEPFLVAADGSVAVLYRDSQLGRRFITMLGRDGGPRPGWPVGVPSEMDGPSLRLDTTAPDGRVVLRSHEPWPVAEMAPLSGLQAQVLAIGPDGTIPTGWPVGLAQPLSAVVGGPDGLLYAVVGDVVYPSRGGTRVGRRYAVIALRPDGTSPAGWPAFLPEGMTPLPADAAEGPILPWAQPPALDTDGRLVVATGGPDDRDGLAWIGPDGTVDTILLPEGWRITSGEPLAGGGKAPLAPVVVGRRAFLAVSIAAAATRSADADAPAIPPPGRATLAGTGRLGTDALVAVEPSGIVPGWPLTLPGGGWIETLLVASDGTIVVAGGSAVRLVLAADPSGAAGSE